jgi:enediyne biosynthesis protein E7
VNVTEDMSKVTLEVVLRVLFSDDLERLTTGSDGNPFALLTDDTERNLAFAYKFRQLGKIILDEVQRRRRDGVRRNDILSQLIDARGRDTAAPMADRQLLDEVMTLIVAGHETTAASLNWFWYLLDSEPEVARRLRAEVDAAEVDSPGYKDLDGLPYTRRTIDETLRLYPPGWLLTRRSIEPDTFGGYSLPAQTDVLISPYLVQRHPSHWPDPDRFDPDRFLLENSAARNRFAYFPFGLGPRACIGEHLALVEMHIHVATLARRFDLQLVPGQVVEIEPQVNLRTRHPLRMIPRVRA